MGFLLSDDENVINQNEAPRSDIIDQILFLIYRLMIDESLTH